MRNIKNISLSLILSFYIFCHNKNRKKSRKSIFLEEELNTENNKHVENNGYNDVCPICIDEDKKNTLKTYEYVIIDIIHIVLKVLKEVKKEKQHILNVVFVGKK